ncbi:InlB B-repeat-containing protein [Sinanaerobacter sp. ZZT-01]|uniref:InlB B-repeat-containing protein n=1 Tax=Sinanaerobacter sp. ZZT-01 TaxID=3111540 RepID=UPI002D798497|nr:InlB B-repeat-containing protein [Sinanaerobacter sp. ZZT-01]WRR92505.1 InlB B-repeat-containing protein [Sinanaerobacter sp. ZZT-01]
MKHEKRNYFLSLTLCMVLILGQIIPVGASYAQDRGTELSGRTESVVQDGGSKDKESDSAVGVSEDEGIDVGENMFEDENTAGEESDNQKEETEEGADEKEFSEMEKTEKESEDVLSEDSATTDDVIKNQEDREEPVEEALKEMISEPVMETLELAFENGLPNIMEYEATTQSAIYFIADAEGIKKLGGLVNSGIDFKGKTLKLTQDIDLELQEWAPIGTKEHPFCGVFDGDGCKVRNLKMETSSLEYIGLFGYIKNAEIKNTEIGEGSTVQGTAEAKNIYAGGIAAYAEESKFINCRNDTNISVLNLSEDGKKNQICTGGIAGYVKKSDLTDCSNKGIITSESEATKNLAHSGGMGGIAGFAEEGNFEGCANEGSISGGWKTETNAKDYPSGGILGYAMDTSLIGCINSGAVTITGYYAGGMIGNAESIEKTMILSNCENNGGIEVKGTKAMYAGGLAGKGTSVEMNDCKNTAGIKGEWYVGGLVGNLGGSASKKSCIQDSSNEGKIEALTKRAGGLTGEAKQSKILRSKNSGDVDSSETAGGIIGYSSVCELSDNYNIGEVNASKKEAGGILGKTASSPVSNCYNLGNVDSLGKKGGISTSTSNLINCYFLEGSVESPEDASVAIAKPETAFLNGEVAFLLNTVEVDEEKTFSGIWGQGDSYLVFADEDILAVGKITCKVKDEAGEEKGGTIVFGKDAEAKPYLIEKSLHLTVTPEDGYILKLLNLTDTDGNKLEKSREDQIDGKIVFTFENPGRSVIAEAIFQKKADDAPETIDVTWNLDGGTIIEGEIPTKVKYGKYLSKPLIEREGYFFENWFAGDNPDTQRDIPYDFETALTADLILTAIWNEDALYITFDPCDGTEPEEAQRFSFEGKFTPKEVSRTASPGMQYKFLGWYTEKDGKGEKWEKDRTIEQRGRLTLYAAWELIDSFESGTTKNPCIIADADTLAALAKKVNEGTEGSAKNGYKGKYFELGSDIDLKKIEQWSPIGTEEHPFFGKFNGAYHTVSNLKIDASELDNQGLFGYVGEDSFVSNLYLENSSVRGENNVGAVIGKMLNCGGFHHLGVIGGNVSAKGNAGGVIGCVSKENFNQDDDFYMLFNTAEVTASVGNAGGLVGGIDTKGTFSRCYNTGDISGNAVGAIAGSSYERSKECYYLDSSIESPVDGAVVEAKSSDFFESGEGAYTFDHGETYSRTKDWSQGEGFPIFADEENGSVFRIFLKQGEGGSASIEGLDEYGASYTNSGTKAIVKVQAEEGWFLKQLSVTEVRSGNTVKADGAGSGAEEVTFIMPEANVYVVPVFVQNGEGKVKITYDLDGGNWGDVPAPSASVPFGTVVEHPSAEPQKTGFTFHGWYAGNEKYLFTEAVTEDLVLKAKWCTNGKFLVSFNLNREGWAGEELPEAFRDQEVEKDGIIKKPEKNPQWVHKDEHTAYKFAGWYTEPIGGIEWNFNLATVAQDTVLYAHWSEVDALSAGTKEYPYPITSAEELQYLAECVNEGNTYADCYFRLESDLDLGNIDSWIPIGTSGVPFSGYFDGNKKTIQNLKIQWKTNYSGLFGAVQNGEIKNLMLEDVNVEGGSYTGAVAGSLNESNLSNLSIQGNVSGMHQVGGIVGVAGEQNSDISNNTDSYLTNLSFDGTVKSENESGGIAGSIVNSTLSGLKVRAEVEGNSQVGGIAGSFYGGVLGNSEVDGAIKGEAHIGGLAGKNGYFKNTRWDTKHGTQFSSCSNFAEVSGGMYVGGLAGYGEMTDKVSKSYNEGAVSGEDFVGGLFGVLDAMSKQNGKRIVSVCYNTGRIKAEASEASGIGGMIGLQKNSGSGALSKITDSFNAGIIESSSASNVGAVCGAGYELNENCYHLLSDRSFADAEYSKSMKQEDFESGYAAYLMDGGTKAHKDLWGQGAGHPVFADETHPSVYEIELIVSGEGSAAGADLQKGLNYKAIKKESMFEVTPDESSITALFEVVDSDGAVLYSGSGKDTLQYKLPSSTSMSIHVTFAEKNNEEFTITFDLRGGKIDGKETIERTKVPFGTKASDLKPSENPVKKIEGAEGEYAFSGWYADEALSQAFNFDTLITGDMTIYAKYKEKATVRFDLNGPTAEEGSTVPAEQELIVGDRVIRPENPTWNATEENGITETHVFIGWSTDSKRWLEWDFTKPLQEEGAGKIITLYAHWKITYAITDEMLEDITDEDILKKLAENVKNGERYIGKILSLGDDITLSGWSQSIGSEATPFEGTFDGNGHVISVENGTTPLFGHIGSSGSLKNVTVSGTMQAKGSDTFGGLVNTNRGIIQNCHAKSLSVEGKDAKAVGGIVGQTIGYLQNCTTDSKSYVSGKNNVGGIAGNINMTVASIKNCENAAHVTSTSDTAGGIAGTDENEGSISAARSQVKECINMGPVEGVRYAGGILGKMTKPLNLEYCKNTGNILSKAGSAGGILGSLSDLSTNPGRIEFLECENIGDVSGKTSVGGITGMANDNILGVIESCKNSGAVTADGAAAAAGGIMGTITKMVSFSKCENSGTVSSTGRFAGGIIGKLASLNDGETAGTISLCSSTGEISCTGDSGVAGGVAGEGYRIENSYSTGKVNGTASYGICKAIQVGTEYVTTIENSYWYNKDGSVDGLSDHVTERTVKNSYYYSSQSEKSSMSGMNGLLGMLGNSASDLQASKEELSASLSSASSEPVMQPEKAFTGGKIAYLLDGGDEVHSGIWTQGTRYPELGEPSCYKIVMGEHIFVNGESTAYANAGSTVDVTVSTPVSDDAAKEYKLSSLKVTNEGVDSDITAAKRFTLGEGNADLSALFDLVAKEEEEKEKPPHKPDGGGGSGNGSGNGNGDGSDDHGTEGEGGGTGTGIGDGSDSGEHDGYYNTGEKTTTTEPNSTFSESQSEKAESLQAAELDEQKEVKKEDEAMKASGGATEGGEGIKEEKKEEKEALNVFEIVKKAAQENPLLAVLLALMILAILILSAASRYRRYRKEQ